jgi:signal transduction histidine kinase
VDIHEGIDSTLMVLQHRLKADLVRPEIVVIKHYGVLPQVECFPGRLNQVLMNVISNAIDAIEERDKNKSIEEMKQDPSTITITTELNAEKQVLIRIADNGKGIPESIRQQVFDPFFTTKPVGKGTGMGLSISYQIITERHHGRLYCHSTPGKGAEFVIEIPVRQG